MNRRIHRWNALVWRHAIADSKPSGTTIAFAYFNGAIPLQESMDLYMESRG